MRLSKLWCFTLGAWGMAAAYNWIYETTGFELGVLLYASIMTLFIGLYVGLYANNNDTRKEEA